MRYIADTLYIEKFRQLVDQEVLLGKKINVFSGQNGVGKSNLLSLIATIFGTKDKRASGGNFFPEFSDYFVINPEENYKEYKSYLKVVSDDDSKQVLQKRHGYKDSRRENRGIRILPRGTSFFEQLGNSESLVSGDSKIPIPTIFLSLSRLFPVGETKISTKNIRSDNKLLTSDIFKKYAEWYNKVLPDSISNSIENGKIIHKNVVKNPNLHISLANATPETQSVGQDNLGCIISALIDFYILKNTKDSYSGGILCIDEVDASLHPSAQLRLFDLLDELCEELSLQVFLSTHSLTILKEILRVKNKKKDEYQLIYIVDPFEPRVSAISTYEQLKADLFDQTNYFRPLVKVYCEDEMTQFILNELLSRELLDKYEIKLPTYEVIPIHLGCNNLKALPEYDTHFKSVAIVLDGDAKTDNTHLLGKYISEESFQGFNNKKLPDNCLALPTYLPPESYLYYILHSLINKEEYRGFWRELDRIPEASLYTKSKLKNKVLNKIHVTDNLSNDLLKQNNLMQDLKDFFLQSKAINYFYLQEQNKQDIKHFLESCQKVFNMVNSRVKASF